VITRQVISTIDITLSIIIHENSIDNGHRYKYRKIVPIQGIVSVLILKNNTVLKNSISKGFKLFTTIKRIIVKSSSRQASK